MRERPRLHRLLRSVLLVALLAAPAGAAPPVDFQNQLVLSGLAQPISFAFLPDGRMLVLQRTGELLLADLQTVPASATPYLDLSSLVESSGERGLFSIALHPEFPSNGFFYLYYTHAPTARHRIARFTHQATGADPASEVLVWEDNEPWSGIGHIGGGLDFGPDGMLYLATGDENSGAQAQDLGRAGGKVVRIAPDGSIPPDNPFLATPGALPEIWALGLRNPTRMRWDAVSERLFVADVGQDTVEELHEGRPGANFGWPACEGVCGSPLYDDPIFTYPHTTEGGAIIGGYVHRDPAFPPPYLGSYYFADFVAGAIRRLEFDGAGDVASSSDFEPTAGGVVELDEGPDGALYYVEFSPFTGEGSVRRIAFQGNAAPVVTQAEATPDAGPGPELLVQFQAAADDAEGDPLAFFWDFGDGSSASGPGVSHTYVGSGLYSAQLTVSDGTSTVAAEPIEIAVGTPPTPVIDAPADGTVFRAGDVIAFSGGASDPEEALGPESLAWDLRVAHDAHAHPELHLEDVAGGQFTVPSTGHDFHDDTSYLLDLTATDSDGLSATTRVRLLPEKAPLVIATEPSGLRILRDGTPHTAPHLYDTLVGFQHEIGALGRQCLDGTDYAFAGWSDGGARSHTITVPESDPVFTASFTALGPCVRTEAGQVALYTFEAGGGTTVGDRSGVAPSLDLEILDPGAVTWLADGGVEVTASARIQSPGDASKLVDASQATDALTVEALIEPASATQFGPARIVALSSGPTSSDEADVMLGQGLSASEPFNYVARVRTSATDALGLPGVVSPNGAAVAERTHVVLTRDAAGLETIFVNGEAVAQATVAGTLEDWTPLPLTLANEATGDRPFLGIFHLVAFYERALLPAEVTGNFLALAPPNEAPIASPDAYETAEDGTLRVGAAAGVLANDSDPDGDPLVAELVSPPSGGTLSLGADGSLRYTADAGTSADSFTYRADDGLRGGEAATVSITVPGTPPPGSRVQAGLVALYTFAAGGGDRVLDRSGVGTPLDLGIAEPGNVTWLGGGGLRVDALTTLGHAGAATKVIDAARATDALTIEAWARPASLSQFGPARIVTLSVDPVQNGGNALLGQGVGPDTGDRYAARVRTTSTNQYGSPELTGPAGTLTTELTHVVLTRDPSGERILYQDGAPVAADAVAGSFDTWRSDASLALANEPTGDRGWLGELQLVALYERALTPAEVRANFEAGPRGADPPPPPSGGALLDPAESTSTDATPLLELSGVRDGDTVSVYTDATCETLVGSAVASGSSVQVTVGPLAPGHYEFYARVEAPEPSACGATGIEYTVVQAAVPALPLWAAGLLLAVLAIPAGAALRGRRAP